MKRRVFIRSSIGTAVSLFFVWLALRDVDWAAFFGAMGSAALLPLLAAAGFAMLGVYLRAIRWAFMVAPVKPVRIWRLFEVLLIGSMANNVLPMRLGELVRAFLLGRSEQISKSAALGTIVYERIVDVFTTLGLLWLALYFTPTPPWMRSSGLWLLVLNSVLMALLLLALLFRRQFADLVERLARPLGQRVSRRVRAICDSFVKGLSVATSLRGTLFICLISVAVILASILAVYCCFPGMNIYISHHPMVIRASITVTVLVSFAIMIPAAPGNVGAIQYACIVGLTLYDVDRGPALAFSLVYHAMHYLPITLAGLVLLWREQIGLIELASTSSNEGR